MKGSQLLAIAVAAVVMVGASSAAARPHTTRSLSTDNGYGYDFKDDVLAAGLSDGYTALIKTSHRSVRRTLIRPRTHFVPEMLMSVEHI